MKIRIQQTLHNLIGNAIKFTEQGEITVSAVIENDRAKITVTDTGIGIPEDNLMAIFDSFEQVQSDTSRVYGVTGLGLAVSKQLIELHGGVLKVESLLSKGSTFSFTLPISSEVATTSLLDKNNITRLQLITDEYDENESDNGSS